MFVPIGISTMTAKKKRLLTAILLIILIAALTLASCTDITAPDDSNAPDISQESIVGIDSSSSSDKSIEASSDESVEESVDIEESNQEVPIDDTQSAAEISIDQNVSAEVSEEQSEESDISEVSEEDISETSEEPVNAPSTLTPIIEFGIGDGDYEVGFDTDPYDFKLTPSSFFVYKDELMVVDYVNARVLLYRDGELVDKFEIKEQCGMTRLVSGVFDDDYYYILIETSGRLYIIDRETKKSVVIDFMPADIPIADYEFVCDSYDYYIKCNEITYGENYEFIFNTRYLKIQEKNVFEVTPKAELIISIDKEECTLNTFNTKIKLQTASPDDEVDALKFFSVGKLDHDAYVVSENWSSIEEDVNGYYKQYKMFYKYNAFGKLVGRYLWNSLCAISNRTGYLLGIDGEFYVICYDVNLKDKSNGKLGIYKVNFGMDETIPPEKRNISVANQAEKATSNNNTVNSSANSEDTHATVSRAAAKILAEEMIDLLWTIKSTDNTTAHCVHASLLEVPPHVANASVGTQLQGIPYSRGGFHNKSLFLTGIDLGYTAGNVSKGLGSGSCVHTVGLDCSGFACRAYGFNERHQSEDLRNMGHIISVGIEEDTDLNQILQPMDLIVQMGSLENRHVMLFIKETDGVVAFYHCTKHYGSDGIQNRATIGHMPKSVFIDMGALITLHDMWACEYVTKYDSSSHWEECTICGETRSNTAHTFNYSAYNAYQHTATCSVCSYQTYASHNLSCQDTGSGTMHQTKCLDCGVANGAAQAHNFIYQIINGNYHRASCSVCLYAQMAAHSFTDGYTYIDANSHKVNCACGYGTSENHTASKIYTYNGSHHMKTCTKCGGDVIREPHVIQNGRCTVCGCTSFVIGSIKDPETIEADISETITEESAVTDD